MLTENDSLTVFKKDNIQQHYCRWAEEEDMLLSKAVLEYGAHSWAIVSRLIPGRTAIQCSNRWFGALNPNVQKGRWSKAEDNALIEAVKRFHTPGLNSYPWNKIAEHIPSRTGIQCQARWTEALDPTVRKGRWNPDEDALLKKAIAKYGCCWIQVASMIPTRTQRQCRTRWNQIHSQNLKTSTIESRQTAENKTNTETSYGAPDLHKSLRKSLRNVTRPYFIPCRFISSFNTDTAQNPMLDPFSTGNDNTHPIDFSHDIPLIEERMTSIDTTSYIINGTGNDLWSSVSSSSPTSICSRSSSYTMSPTPPGLPVTPVNEQYLFASERNMNSIEKYDFTNQIQTNKYDFLNNSDFDFLLDFMDH